MAFDDFAFSLLLLLLVATDLRFRIIPKHLNFFCFVILFLNFTFQKVIWALLLFLIYSLLFRICRGSVGYGDVRLAPVAAFAVQDQSPLVIHAFAWVGAGIFLLIKGNTCRSVPFAPFLAFSLVSIMHL